MSAQRGRPEGGAERGHRPLLWQQSDSELRQSEWHSQLDTVLRWLQGIGYTLLNDAEPAPGGGVRLTQSQAKRAPWVDNKKSARIPDERPRDAQPRRALPGVGEAPSLMDHETIQAIQIGENARKYALYKDDLVLVTRFAALLAAVTPDAADKVKHDTFYKTVLQGIRLMHQCDFDYSDIVVTLAYASIYFRSTYEDIGGMMTEMEAANVCTLLIFLAHSFVLDETCPLRCWQKHVFRRYCSLKVLDAALFRLFKLRGFRLQLNETEEKDALCYLLGPRALAWVAATALTGHGSPAIEQMRKEIRGCRHARCPQCDAVWKLPDPPSGVCTRCPGGVPVHIEEADGSADSSAAGSSHEPHGRSASSSPGDQAAQCHKGNGYKRGGHHAR